MHARLCARSRTLCLSSMQNLGRAISTNIQRPMKKEAHPIQWSSSCEHPSNVLLTPLPLYFFMTFVRSLFLYNAQTCFALGQAYPPSAQIDFDESLPTGPSVHDKAVRRAEHSGLSSKQMTSQLFWILVGVFLWMEWSSLFLIRNSKT